MNQDCNASKNDPDEVATIKGRIKRAAKEYGVEIAEGGAKGRDRGPERTTHVP